MNEFSDYDAPITPEEQAEIDEALKEWVPYWRKPVSIDEWEKLLAQKKSMAAFAIESHIVAREIGANLRLRQVIARRRYRALNRYMRTLRRMNQEKIRLYHDLEHTLGVSDEEVN